MIKKKNQASSSGQNTLNGFIYNVALKETLTADRIGRQKEKKKKEEKQTDPKKCIYQRIIKELAVLWSHNFSLYFCIFEEIMVRTKSKSK